MAIVTQGLTNGGGVPTVARWLRDGLTGIGHQVDVHDLATSRRDPHSRRAAMPGTWRRRSLRGPFDEATDSLSWGANLVELEPMRYLPRSELTRVIREYDVIQVVAGGPALAYAVIGAGPPVFLQVATRARWERQTRRTTLSVPSRAWSDTMTAWTSRLEARAIAGVDGVFVENAVMQSFARSAGQPNVYLAPPGLDTDRFCPSSAGWNPSGYLLSVCRLAEPRKRLDRLIRVYWRLVQQDASTADLILAGRGCLPTELRELVDQLGLTARVHVRNDVAAEDLSDLYRGASVYVQTSDEEGLGISVLEAMASGLPVVATETAGSRECVVDERTGYLVRHDDEATIMQSFTERIRQVLATTGAEMARRGRERSLQEFSTKHSLERFTTVYDRWFAS